MPAARSDDLPPYEIIFIHTFIRRMHLSIYMCVYNIDCNSPPPPLALSVHSCWDLLIQTFLSPPSSCFSLLAIQRPSILSLFGEPNGPSVYLYIPYIE